jgi:hypothetical protein
MEFPPWPKVWYIFFPGTNTLAYFAGVYKDEEKKFL